MSKLRQEAERFYHKGFTTRDTKVEHKEHKGFTSERFYHKDFTTMGTKVEHKGAKEYCHKKGRKAHVLKNRFVTPFDTINGIKY